MTHEEMEKKAYRVMSKNSGLKVGDTVKLLRNYEAYENGCGIRSNKKCVSLIGTLHTIITIDLDGDINLSDTYWYPFFVLEKIKSAPTDLDGIPDFGCQNDNVKTLITNVLDKRYQKKD